MSDGSTQAVTGGAVPPDDEGADPAYDVERDTGLGVETSDDDVAPEDLNESEES